MRIESEPMSGGFTFELDVHRITPCRRVTGTDRLTNEAVFSGPHPDLTPVILDYMAENIHRFVTTH